MTLSWHTPDLAYFIGTLQWRHNECDGVSNHWHIHCLRNFLFRRRSKKTSKPRVTGVCDGNSPVTGDFPAPKSSTAENVSISWRQHEWSKRVRTNEFTVKRTNEWIKQISLISVDTITRKRSTGKSCVYIWGCTIACCFLTRHAQSN